MAHIYKCSEWESASGKFYVNDVEDLAGISGKWWVPARMLCMDLCDYIILLKDKFNANIMCYNAETDVLVFSFNTLAEARKYKNWINKESRSRKFMI